MSLRSLVRASALYTVANMAPKVGAFLLLPVYVRFLAPEDFGSLSLMTSLAGVLALVYHLGLDSAVMRLHFDIGGAERSRLYSTATLFSIGLGAVATVVLALALGPFFDQIFAGVPFVPLGALALLLALFGSLQYVTSTLFRATGQAGRFVLINVGTFLVSSVTSVLLVTVFRLGATGVLVGQLLGALVVLGITIVVVGRLGPWSFDRAGLREALGLGLPLLPHGIASWALRLGDRWLIALLIGLPALQAREQIGVYSVGYQLGFIVSIVITSFNSSWSPYFFRIGYRPSGPAFYREMTTIVIGGLIVLATGASALAPEIVAVIARPGYEAAADVLPVIAFASVFQGVYVMFVTVVFLAKRTGRLAAITISSAALNVVLNVVLIPSIGILGAAWATMGSYVFLAAATYAYARGMYEMRVDWARIAAMLAIAIVAVGVSRWLAPNPSLASGVVHSLAALVVVVCIGGIAWTPLQRLRLVSRSLPAER